MLKQNCHKHGTKITDRGTYVPETEHRLSSADEERLEICRRQNWSDFFTASAWFLCWWQSLRAL